MFVENVRGVFFAEVGGAVSPHAAAAALAATEAKLLARAMEV